MLLEFSLACAIAFGASALACRLVIAIGIEDAPELARKAHGAPTPTSAGLAIALGVALAIVFLVVPPVRAWSANISREAAADTGIALVAAFGFLAIGALDDVRPLSARLKIAVFAAAALSVPLFAMRVDAIALGAGAVLQLAPALAIIGSAAWVFTMVNVANFMDGANGLSMGSLAIGLFFLGLIALDAGRFQTAALSFCTAAALAGFLIWNFPSGRVFAGDSGSLFAGAIAAIASLLMVRSGLVSALIPPILFFPLLADVFMTLAWRIGKGADILVGHSHHLYQIAIRAGKSHAHVTVRYWGAAALCGVLAVLAVEIGRGEVAADLLGARGRALASYAPLAAFLLCAMTALAINQRLRRFARARGFDNL